MYAVMIKLIEAMEKSLKEMRENWKVELELTL